MILDYDGKFFIAPPLGLITYFYKKFCKITNCFKKPNYFTFDFNLAITNWLILLINEELNSSITCDKINIEWKALNTIINKLSSIIP